MCNCCDCRAAGQVFSADQPPTAGAACQLYKGSWAPTGSLAAARIGHRAVLLKDGSVLAAGGFGVHPGTMLSADAPLDACLLLPGAFQAREVYQVQQGTAMLCLPDAGGRNNSARLASAERYAPGAGSWSPAGALRTAVDGFAMAL